MELFEIKKKYLKQIDCAIAELQGLLQDIKSVESFGWEGRKQCSVAANALEQAKYWFKHKMALDNDNETFIQKQKSINKCFVIIERELSQVDKFLQN